MNTSLLSPGEIIEGRYKILEFTGEGGMQEVYKASDSLLSREVAVKTPKNISAIKRFRRSAVISARINHQCVAKTLDYLETLSREYLVEEFIEGLDLSQLLTKMPWGIDPYLAARLFHRLARGLAASHHVNVFHRDLKPSNIMVVGGAKFSEVKITDFGIAKMADTEISEALEKGDEQSMAASKTAFGALPYMAPESFEASTPPSMPADIWALGAIMYEAISGQKPFGTGYQAIPKILTATPPKLPITISNNIQFEPLGRQVYDLCLKCLKKKPEDRPTADDVAKACEIFCYSAAERELGTISRMKNSAWGFIDSDLGDSVFLHKNCIYGPVQPKVGQRVMFSRFSGGGADRAFPIVVLSLP